MGLRAARWEAGPLKRGRVGMTGLGAVEEEAAAATAYQPLLNFDQDVSRKLGIMLR